MNESSADIESDIESELIDLTDLTLDGLLDHHEGEFASAARRVLDRIDSAESSISGYSGSATPDRTGAVDTAAPGQDSAPLR
jgi:hypothetical protein